MTTTYDTTITLTVEHQAVGLARAINGLRALMEVYADDGWQAEHGITAHKIGTNEFHLIAYMRKDVTMPSAGLVPLASDTATATDDEPGTLAGLLVTEHTPQP